MRSTVVTSVGWRRLPVDPRPPIALDQGGGAGRAGPRGGLAASDSTDGRVLYYAKNALSPTSIWRVPVGGGDETPVLEGLSYSLNFVVADRGLYFVAVGGAPEKTSLDFFDFGTGRRSTLLGLGQPFWYGTALSPDRRTLLYSNLSSLTTSEFPAFPGQAAASNAAAHWFIRDVLYRSGSNAARSSEAKSAGSSHAAKCPPRSTSLK